MLWLVDRRLTAVSFMHFVALLAQEGGDTPKQYRIVIDDQDLLFEQDSRPPYIGMPNFPLDQFGFGTRGL